MGRFAPLVLQTTVAWIASVVLQIVTVVITTPPFDGGIASVGWPLSWAVTGVLVNLAVLVVGLPVRLIPPVPRWLARHAWLTIAIAAGGVALLVAAFGLAAPVVRENELGHPVPGLEPDVFLYLGGWLLLVFGIVHTWLPAPATWSFADRDLQRKLARGRALSTEEADRLRRRVP